jgi:hypothetical protein
MSDTMFARRSTGTKTLDDAATDIFHLLGLKNTEERESSNYVDGYYFVGNAANASVKVCLSDGATLPDFPFWVTLQSPRSWVKDVTEKVSTETTEVAAILSKGGWEIFVPIGNWAREDWDERGTLYAP